MGSLPACTRAVRLGGLEVPEVGVRGPRYAWLPTCPATTHAPAGSGSASRARVPLGPEPEPPAVQGGTRRYKALYLHVFPCTLIFRGTGHLGTHLILPCTTLYRLVSRYGIARDFWVANSHKCWYVPVCTCIYCFILVYTWSY